MKNAIFILSSFVLLFSSCTNSGGQTKSGEQTNSGGQKFIGIWQELIPGPKVEIFIKKEGEIYAVNTESIEIDYKLKDGSLVPANASYGVYGDIQYFKSSGQIRFLNAYWKKTSDKTP